MADFKLGLSGAESNLPLGVAEELPTDSDEAVEEYRCSDGSYKYAFKEHVRRTWTIEFTEITAAEIATLDGIYAIKATLNYINGYDASIPVGGVSVIVSNYSGPRLITNTSGLATPRYNATMELKEVC